MKEFPKVWCRAYLLISAVSVGELRRVTAPAIHNRNPFYHGDVNIKQICLDVLIRIKCGFVFTVLVVYVLIRYRSIYRRHCLRSGRYSFKSGRLANPVFPKVYYDKVLWRKLFDHAKTFTDMTDKLKARKIALAMSADIKTTEIVWQGNSIEDFPLDDIEKPCIVKFNTGSGWYYVVKDASPKTKVELTDKMKSLARKRIYGREKGEWAYRDIEMQLYAEKLLVDRNNIPPDDYKLFFCNGKLVQVSVAHDRWGNRAFVRFDSNLNSMGVDRPGWRSDYEPREWHIIDRAIRVGRQLAGDMDFVRIDLYVFEGEIYFGEFTLYPGSGRQAPRDVADGRGEKWDIRESLYFKGKIGFFKRIYLECLDFVYRDTLWAPSDS